MNTEDSTDGEATEATVPGEGPPPLRTRRRLAWLASGAAVFLLYQLSTLAPGLVGTVYADGVGPFLAGLLSGISGFFPFSLAQVLVGAYLAALAVLAIAALLQVRRGVRTARHAVTGGALRLGRDAGVAVVLFYLLWGFHYAAPSLERRAGLPDGRDAAVVELERLADQAVRATNAAYLSLHGTEDAGDPTSLTGWQRTALQRDLVEGWRRAAAELGLPDHFARDYGPAKAFVPGSMLARLGIGGFYFPFTGEAVLNTDAPGPSVVFAMAHESAHQRGVTSEDEANFLGFLAAARAPSDLARYAAYLKAQDHLLSELERADPQARERLAAERLPGVRRDLVARAEYSRRYAGAAREISSRLNHAYLRSQGVEGGIRSYGMATWLLVAYARTRDGVLVEDLDAPAGGG